MWPVALVLLATCWPGENFGDDSLPPHQRIDQLIAAGTENYADIATPIADDAEFLRRVSLDLVGTIPTVEETRAFLTDTSPDKRTVLVDRLLADPRHARHLANWIDNWLMQRRSQTSVPLDQWSAFLLAACREDRPLNVTVQEMLANDGSNVDNRGPAQFILGRNADKDTLTRDISGLLLGASLECAQCHDHPHVGTFLQRHYHSLSAFMVRSSLFTTPEGVVMLAETADGESTFEDVFLIKANASPGPQNATPAVFDGPGVTEPSFAEGEAYEVAPAEGVRSIPKFSRRSQLASAVVNDPRFPRNAANRLWAMLLGRGLVEPLDMLHEDNPATHPELLDLLTTEFTAHEQRLNHLIREIVLSDTYQRSSRSLDASGQKIEPPAPETFAVMPLRPLSPRQFAQAVLEATGETGNHRSALGEGATEESLHAALVGYENAFQNLLQAPAGHPDGEFEAMVQHALWYSNEGTLNNLVAPHGNNLATRLAAYPPEQTHQLIEELFLATLTRLPTADEEVLLTDFLVHATPETRSQVIQDAIWAAVTSAEMRFNH
jgi:hypothetical protein